MPLDDFLRRAVARVRLRDLLRGVAASAVVAVAVLFLVRSDAIAVFVAITGVVLTFAWARRVRTPRAAAVLIERGDPTLRNLIVTAQQLLEQPGLTRTQMRERVLAEASRRAESIELRRSIPMARESVLAVVAVTLLVLSATVKLPARSAPQISKFPNSQISKSSDPRLTLTLTPPSYSGRPSVTVTDPSAIEVLAGTQGAFAFDNAAGARLRLNGTPVEGSSVTFAKSGFVALDGGGLDRIVPVTVVPDRAPDVRVTAPAKDLRLPSTATTIPIAVDATDDLALESFELRYTIVSGTGEQFSFTEGTLAASVTRTSAKAWKLEAPLSLTKLKLEPGDALIYRAVAADKRPGDAGVTSSDTFFVEIAGPGDVPLEGVEMPPDRERYALSQAMIVLKIERLREREKSLARDALVDAAGTIAAEQRAVRANFIFLLGGEIQEEEEEAAHEHEVAEGRLANQARREITNAISLMGRVEKALGAVSTGDALPPAREAVKALQRAFGHSRYLLRALPSRARIDPARRLSGDVSTAVDWSRGLAAPAADPLAESARSALNELVLISAEIVRFKLEAAGDRGRLAARLDRVGEQLLMGGNAELRAAARDILAARTAVSQGRFDEARETLKKSAGPLVKHAQRGRIDGATVPRDAARTSGAAAIARREGRR